MADLEKFRSETHAWLEANAPKSLFGARAGAQEGVWGGKKAVYPDPDRKLWLDVANQLEEMPKATVCQIHGGCIGGALETALACDLRTMAAEAIAGLPETRIGLIPDVGGSSRLPWPRLRTPMV